MGGNSNAVADVSAVEILIFYNRSTNSQPDHGYRDSASCW